VKGFEYDGWPGFMLGCEEHKVEQPHGVEGRGVVAKKMQGVVQPVPLNPLSQVRFQWSIADDRQVVVKSPIQ
jgi:hypothetical protein